MKRLQVICATASAVVMGFWVLCAASTLTGCSRGISSQDAQRVARVFLQTVVEGDDEAFQEIAGAGIGDLAATRKVLLSAAPATPPSVRILGAIEGGAGSTMVEASLEWTTGVEPRAIEVFVTSVDGSPRVTDVRNVTP